MLDASGSVAASLSWSVMQDGYHAERSCNEMTASASSHFPSISNTVLRILEEMSQKRPSEQVC